MSVLAMLLGIDSLTRAWCVSWGEALSSSVLRSNASRIWGPDDFMVKIMFSSDINRKTRRWSRGSVRFFKSSSIYINFHSEPPHGYLPGGYRYDQVVLNLRGLVPEKGHITFPSR
jgi:hypothetical protein